MKSLRRTWMFVAAALLLAAATSLAPAQQPVPSFTMEPTEWNLGEVQGEQTYRETFKITNAGEGPLAIQLGLASSERLTGELTPLGTQPGKEYQLMLSLSTEGLSGPYAGYLYLHTNDPENGAVKIEVKATVIAAATADEILIMYMEDDEETKAIRDKVNELLEAQPGTNIRVLSLGDADNYQIFLRLKQAFNITQGFRHYLFTNKVAFTGAERTLQALQGLIEGEELTAGGAGARTEPMHTHQEGEASIGAISGSTLPPYPRIEVCFDNKCETCRDLVKERLTGWGETFGNRVRVSLFDLADPKLLLSLRERIPITQMPQGTRFVLILDGEAFWAGGVETFEAAAVALEAELAERPEEGARAAEDLSSPSYRMTVGARGEKEGAEQGAAAEAAGTAQYLWILWIALAVLGLLAVFMSIVALTMIRRMGKPGGSS